MEADMSRPWFGPLGAEVRGGPTTRFSLFTSSASQCAVRLFHDGRTPSRTLPMHARGGGLFELSIEDVGHGALYKFVLDERELPDPYARYLPHGVHGPAMVVEPRYVFHHPRPAQRAPGQRVIYELHVGTFTEHGTYAAACLRLPLLVELGVTTLELMPVAAFAGTRGWGYDGVAAYAPFAGYGTPDELRALVDAAHGLGLSVLLDVVYNHFGPAGNYLSAYSPDYFTKNAHNAWGEALNYAFAPMRALAIDNARYWLEEFRFDGLRLDAVHAIVDESTPHVVKELVDEARRVCPHALLIAEDDRNDPALVRELGLDAIWADDFHHQMHVTLTRERDGYYGAYQPGAADLARAIERGWLYEGQTFSVSERPRGKPATELSAAAFVYCVQNHDQVGNRALGTRLSRDISLDAYCMASTVLLFLPMTPLLFMGQEWAASTPFLFFTDHDAELGEKVVHGRREEFKTFAAFADPAARERIPDPQAPATFERSKLDWSERERDEHTRVLELYRQLLALRQTDPVFMHAGRAELTARARGELLEVRRAWQGEERVLWANLGPEPVPIAFEPGRKTLLIGELDAQGKLAPASAVVVASAPDLAER
jgi:maltooligosyltrehalose trehalohydrolase